MREIAIPHRPINPRRGRIAQRADDGLNRGHPRIRHFVVARLVWVKLVRHIRERHRRAHIEEGDPPPRRRMSIHTRLNERIKLGLNRGVERLISLHQIRHNNVRIRAQRRHFQNERINAVDGIHRVETLPEVVRPDVQQNHIRVRKRGEPTGHICIELIDAPPAVPFVILVRDARAIRRQ